MATGSPSTPKRKRSAGPSLVTSFENTAAGGEDSANGASPRSAVASRLSDFQLKSDEGPRLGGNVVTDNMPKSPKQRSRLAEFHRDGQDSVGQENIGIWHSRADDLGTGNGYLGWRDDATLASTRTENPMSPARSRTLTMPGATPTTLETSAWPSESNSPKSSPSKRKKSPPPPSVGKNPSPLVWHESEITGHLMDNPDDDGVGINGIGFKPTPAMAYARMQKRKQQVAEWKAREARDARQQRSNRRWRGNGADSVGPVLRAGREEGIVEKKRMVRFEA